MLRIMAAQLVNSKVRTTREYWRREVWGWPEWVVVDPRSTQEILSELKQTTEN